VRYVTPMRLFLFLTLVAFFVIQASIEVDEGGSSDSTPVEVKVQARNPDEVAITGVPAGANVALVDPEKKDQKR